MPAIFNRVEPQTFTVSVGSLLVKRRRVRMEMIEKVPKQSMVIGQAKRSARNPRKFELIKQCSASIPGGRECVVVEPEAQLPKM